MASAWQARRALSKVFESSVTNGTDTLEVGRDRLSQKKYSEEITVRERKRCCDTSAKITNVIGHIAKSVTRRNKYVTRVT